VKNRYNLGKPERGASNMAEVISMNQLPLVRNGAHDAGLKVVFTSGGFDGLHSGHRSWLEDCRGIAGDNILVVTISNDQVLKAAKDLRRPLFPEEVRAEGVAHTEFPDYVVIDREEKFGGMAHLRVLDALCPDIWITPENGIISLATKRAVAQRRGIELFVMERRPPKGLARISTTEVFDEYRECLNDLDARRRP
jgi:cytidyltransferase-like protein